MSDRSLFQALQKDFTDNVSLDSLVPELNRERGLLTDADEQKLTNTNVTHYTRVIGLTQILRRKGPRCHGLVIKCLRREGGLGHVNLANLMERYLSERGAQLSRDAHDLAGHERGRDDAASRSETPSQLQNPLSTTAPVHCSEHLTSLELVSNSQGIGNSRPCASQPSTIQASSSLGYNHPSSCPLPSVAFDPPSSSLQLPAYLNQELVSSLPMSRNYNTMISSVCTSLASMQISFSIVLTTLQELFLCIDICINIPACVDTIPSLLEFLRSQRMCHECDVDLLCKLLCELKQNDLHQEVKSYAQSFMHHDVLSLGKRYAQPHRGFFLTFTFHNCPSLTFGQACEVKDIISDLLGIGRHMFWLSSSEIGSVVLGWNFKTEISKHVCTTFKEASVQTQLLSNSHMHSVLRIQIQTEGVGRHVIFNITPEQSISQTFSSTHQIHSRSSKTHSPSSLPYTQSHSGATFSHVYKKEEEGAVSSTVIDSDFSQLHKGHPSSETSYPQPGTKRKHFADSTADTVQSTPTKRACIIGRSTTDSEEAIDGQTSITVAPMEFSELNSPSCPPHSVRSQGAARIPFYCEPELPYQRILRESEPYMVERINLMSLLPHLNAQGLLTNAENENLQLREVTEYNRALQLLNMLQKKGEDGFRKFIAALLSASDHLSHCQIAERLKQCAPPTLLYLLPTSPRATPFLRSPSPIDALVDNLKATYTGKHFFQRGAGPRFGSIEFINLALVKKQGIREEDRWNDKFLQASLHGLVDDIAKKKRSLHIEKIFDYGKKERKLVLTEGSPGVGKTMLAMKLCCDWAESKFLCEYNVVLLIELRRFQDTTKLGVGDLVGVYLEGEIATQVTQHLVKTGGKKVLIILEGWDELSPKLRQEFSFFFSLIKGEKLPLASIMVTSRPSVTAPLYDYMDDRRVEVLGFTSEQQDEYVRKNVHDDQRAKSVLSHLIQFPNLRALAHIPLTLAIICAVATKASCLPVTLTELYDRYTCNALFQNLKKKNDHFSSLSGLNSLEELPDDVSVMVKALSKLALQGFEQKRFVFRSYDLEKAGIPNSSGFDAFGLLSTPLKSATAGHELFYQFRHLSIQEFLAALAIKILRDESRLQLLKIFRSDKQFQNVWKFFSGITKLQDQAFRDMVINSTRPGNRDQLFLLHCLYEAQNPSICKVAADKMSHHLYLGNVTLNACDCLCTAYILGCAEGEWEVQLRGCNIGGDGLEVIKRQLFNHSLLHLKITKFDLMHNHLMGSDLHHLTELLRQLQVVEIDLGSNKFGDEGVAEIVCALKNNKIVERIHFANCNLTSESGRLVADMLKQNTTLKDVFLGFEKLQDEGVQHLASALRENNTLEKLSLSGTGLTCVGLAAITEALKNNKALKVIRFDRNELGPEDCSLIAEIIRHNNTLELIDLSKNMIGDVGFCTVMDALIATHGTLKKIGVYGCGITGKYIYKLIDLFKDTTSFKGIQLGLNAIGDEGARCIAEALHQNTSQSVKDIYLEGTNISAPARHMLEELSQSRDDLTVTFVHHAVHEKMKEKEREEMLVQSNPPS